MEFGLNVVPVHPSGLAELAVRAEVLGFESLWVGEHVVTPVQLSYDYPSATGKPPFAPNSRFLEPFSTLSYLAAVTTTVRLGTGVVILPLHPVMTLARSIATADVLSAGRLILGLGVGWMREEFDAVGAGFSDRGRRADEMIAALFALFTEDRPAFEGEFHHLPPMGFEPKPVQQPHPPFVIGGTSDAALRRAARWGDGWYGGGSPRELSATVERLRTLRSEYGRAHLPFETTALAGWAQTYDAGYVSELSAAGVDRVVVTPWARSREALNATDAFARAAALTPRRADEPVRQPRSDRRG